MASDDDILPLCANGCGFYGRPETHDMCSKCYRDLVLNNNVVPAAATTVAELSPSVEAQEFSHAEVAVLPIPEGEKKVETKPGRCSQCNKKVGLARVFSCRCGGTYCPSHRYAEEHDCKFDFKAAAQKFIAKANPVIKPDKLERI